MDKRKDFFIKKYFALLLGIVLVLSLAGCNSPGGNAPTTQSQTPVATSSGSSAPEESAGISNGNTSAPELSDSTPSAENEEGAPSETAEGTAVALTIGDAIIPATLNDTATAQAFIEQLPFTASASKMQCGFCGAVASLPCDDAERQAGWKNGDTGYSNGWFALFHSGEDESSSYTGEMIIGHINDSCLDAVRALRGNVKITVTLAEWEESE
jgi:hypothetical protein